MLHLATRVQSYKHNSLLSTFCLEEQSCWCCKVHTKCMHYLWPCFRAAADGISLHCFMLSDGSYRAGLLAHSPLLSAPESHVCLFISASCEMPRPRALNNRCKDDRKRE